MTVETGAPISHRFGADPAHRAEGRTVRWTQIPPSRSVSCDECFAVQYETNGVYRRRARARYRRTVAGAALLLCAWHRAAWQDRDRHGA
ncbi:hypothetical protein [Nocardia paucivorans]|uniref:hypothetical protein n=1 Tax=Nocardia paucivorans TaxID=114259 RepID=UPI000593F6F8|nr:hypothetical protein [Nocardia paucivorans]